MTNKTKASELKHKLQKTRELYSTVEKKPQGLESLEIRKRVEGFLLEQSKLWDIFAFGEGIAIGNNGTADAQFDPSKSFKNDPSKLDQIIELVRHDLRFREAELLEEASTVIASRNTLLFGVALKISNDEKLTDDLKEFLVEHLINPQENEKKNAGRPKVTSLSEQFRYQAIEFARQHGLKPTRRTNNKATQSGNSAEASACDAVSAAATALYQAGHKEFNQGNSFDSLKKIWNKYSKL
jgi:hypothetical protein